jgi:hypothetical protein
VYPYIPYRNYAFRTPLSDVEIRKAVEPHAHLGSLDGMFIKSKPYHGEVTPGYLHLRACSHFKKYGYGPALVVYFAPRDGGQQATLSVRPHGLLLALAALFVGFSVIALLGSLGAFFGSWDFSPVVAWSINTAALTVLFALPYHLAAEKIVRFWIRELWLTSSH